jgi:hypothetical protein
MGMRGRFILRYTGHGPTPDAHLAHLRALPGTKVLDESDKMLLVEGHQQDLEKATSALDGWVLTAEKTVPVPDTRKKIKGGPE